MLLKILWSIFIFILFLFSMFMLIETNSEYIEICGKLKGTFYTKNIECEIITEEYSYLLNKESLDSLIEVRNILKIK